MLVVTVCTRRLRQPESGSETEREQRGRRGIPGFGSRNSPTHTPTQGRPACLGRSDFVNNGDNGAVSQGRRYRVGIGDRQVDQHAEILLLDRSVSWGPRKETGDRARRTPSGR